MTNSVKKVASFLTHATDGGGDLLAQCFPMLVVIVGVDPSNIAHNGLEKAKKTAFIVFRFEDCTILQNAIRRNKF